MSGFSHEIGRKIRDAVDNHRREADDHRQEAVHHDDQADSIDDAWTRHEFQWLKDAGVISARDLNQIERAMAENKGRGRKRTSRKRR